MKLALNTWLDFRLHCIRRMANRNLEHLSRRREVVEGLIAVVVGGALDDVIKTIRGSRGTAVETRELLMGIDLPGDFKGKSLTESQADAVLALKLSQLTKLNSDKLEDELVELNQSIDNEEQILKNDRVAYDVIAEDLTFIKSKFNRGGRKTTIVGVTDRAEGNSAIKSDENNSELSSLDFDVNADPTQLEMR